MHFFVVEEDFFFYSSWGALTRTSPPRAAATMVSQTTPRPIQSVFLLTASPLTTAAHDIARHVSRMRARAHELVWCLSYLIEPPRMMYPRSGFFRQLSV